MHKSKTYIPIDDFNAIDLEKTALIEASAGTGKTYTIENLVIRLLIEHHDIDLENILLVTFTEKATSELKLRIRQKLEQILLKLQMHEHPSIIKIQDALDAFDSAAIFTIHGFCNTLLQDFSFENRMLFENELINDKMVFESVLREQIRSCWPKTYGRYLKDILAVSGFDGQKLGFVSKIITLARRLYQPDAGNILLPDVESLNFRQLFDDIEKDTLDLKELMVRSEMFSAGYEQLNINSRSKNAILRDIVLPLEKVVSAFDASQPEFYTLSECLKKIGKSKFSGKQGIQSIIPEKWLKKGENSHVCPNLKTVAETVKQMDGKLTQLAHLLEIQSAIQLQKDVALHKQQNGWISYDDMLRHVKNALYDRKNQKLVDALRNRYKVAFVDEFQDTDYIQWAIFKKIFIDHDNKINRVFLIGDPKQAIYAFRGADVFTYLEARSVIENMAFNANANLYCLKNNYRSSKDLVTTLNSVFASGAWFSKTVDGDFFEIGFTPAKSPKSELMPEQLISDRSGALPVNLVDLRQSKNAGSARQLFCGFIPGEIYRLVHLGNIKIQNKNGAVRPLGYNDIAILVRGKSDFNHLEPHLKTHHVPYSYYKKPGLWQSEQAWYLKVVFQAVLQPDNMSAVKKMLLTPYFNWHPIDLNKAEMLTPIHPVSRVLYKWNRLSRKGQWGRLFQSISADSGFVFRECVKQDWERVESNCHQIFDCLETAAYEKQMDFRSLCALLDGYVKGGDDLFDKDDIHQIETEDPKVQVMTMHVSKGLEFPIVFVAGGLTSPASNNLSIYHVKDEEGEENPYKKVIDVSKETGRQMAEKESEDEDKRLYYVAFTRAKFKLYLPFYPQTNNRPSNGPACRFIATSIIQGLAPDKNKDCRYLIDPSKEQGPILHRQQDSGAIPAPTEIDWTLRAPNDCSDRTISLSSFSSLNHMISKYEKKNLFDSQIPEKEREPDEAVLKPDDVIHEAVSENRLPGGPVMGTLFHDILEHIDFGEMSYHYEGMTQNRKVMAVIDQYMNVHSVDRMWRDDIAMIIFKTLTMPVDLKGDQLLLKNLKPENRRHEVEFFYPLKNATEKIPTITGCKTSANSNGKQFIRGYIDLIFRHHDKFYIADWKSNIIDSGYDEKSIENNMEASGYTLQYKLYAIAALRWLKKVMGDRFEPEKHFGGVLYFYLRGMIKERQGVFFKPFDALPGLEALESQITEITNEKQKKYDSYA